MTHRRLRPPAARALRGLCYNTRCHTPYRFLPCTRSQPHISRSLEGSRAGGGADERRAPRHAGGADDQARQKIVGREGGRRVPLAPLHARASASWKRRRVRARSRCSTVIASPAGRGAAAEGGPRSWLDSCERERGGSDRAGAGGCGGGAPRPHGPMTPAGPMPARSARSRPPPAAQREPVPGEVVGRDSLRGQPSPKFDAGRAGCKVAAATDSDGWVASRLRAARACHLGTSVRACALGWRQSPRQLSGCSGRARYRPAEQRDALPHPWAMYQQLGKVPRGRTRHPARRPRHVIGGWPWPTRPDDTFIP